MLKHNLNRLITNFKFNQDLILLKNVFIKKYIQQSNTYIEF